MGWLLFQVTPSPSVPTPLVHLNTPPTLQITFTPHPTPLDPAFGEALETLERLRNTTVPSRNLNDLARRLEGKRSIPSVQPARSYRQGDREHFWVANVDTNQNFNVAANLAYVADCAYFWIEEGIRYNASDLQDLAETFCKHIYPTTREFFGSEWNPGIDNDPRIYILYTSGLGNSVAAYFSSSDSIHPLAQEYSNAHEMFIVNADNTPLDDPYTYGVLAHEFQHMIHWYRDRNEESWLNEGFSELAAFLNDYDPGGFDYLFAREPDLQLNDWPNDPNATTPHYGASFLFVAYFLDRFGEEATQALVAHPDNGMDSLDAVLRDLGATDPLTGQPYTADDVFVDWTVTNYLQDPSLNDGRYAYYRYKIPPVFSATENLQQCNTTEISGTVNQYGADYIRIACPGRLRLLFEGNQKVGVLPEGAYSGNYAFWSNKGDESDMTLTQTFDFTTVEGPITLTYWTWYDLEKDYDYLYLLASENGEDWQILTTPSCTTDDPSGNSYGCGYNGSSSGYIQEHVDLSQFAGKRVTLRFEYITDAAVNGEGFLLDDVAIPAIGYFSDFEKDDGGWQAEGFVRIQNQLPQTFRLTLIRQGPTTVIEPLVLDANQRAEFEFTLNTQETATLIISGTTRFTRQPASYRLFVEQR
ncbi:immune inhibitor A domain-containing protein [uncultured Thermanaerothrix sp.]|uniref:immune inhibitor A domain-containing protein n=1 Tax=uncultured Thermanaerothrix sp. TaxID=1195149 RepID=UPI002602750D|nr:immune inhibitor A domain-containing protein [uncultured Thermanaerothrix sp.]